MSISFCPDHLESKIETLSFQRMLLIIGLLILSLNLSAQFNPISKREIMFYSDTTKLSGTIYTPQKPKAALLIVHGSGQEKRMDSFAGDLAKAGFCVLTYDKRGVGESGGVYAGPEVGTNNIDSANLTLLAADASAAVAYLSKQARPSKLKIGLIGGSQAGWIIPLAAQKNKQIDFMVIFSGALVTPKEQLRFQFYTAGDAQFWDKHSEKEARQHIKHDPDKYEFIDINPLHALAKLTIPGIWIWGGKDIQVPTNLSIENLGKLKEVNKGYSYVLYPELGHNTAFSDSPAPMKKAVEWMRKISSK